MKKIIIIGANGFLGTKLSLSFANNGHQVIAFVNKELKHEHLENNSNITILDFTFDELLSKDYFIDNVDLIYNLAWLGVDSTYKNNELIQVKNIDYYLTVMIFAKKYNIKRVVIPGSASEYACSGRIIDGEGKEMPSDIYSATKVAAHYICEMYAKQHNIEFIWTLITSIYGPGRSDNNLITYTIKTLLKGDKPIFTKLEQEWDYIFIDDLIDALKLVGLKGRAFITYPIGSGEHKQLVDYVTIIRDMIDPKAALNIGVLPYKNETIDNQILNISKLQKDTGFKTNFNFEKGIIDTINYFRNKL